MIKKCVHQRDVEFAGTYQIIAKFVDRQCPVISPCRAAVVDGRLRGASYLRQTSRCESWRQSAPDVVIDPAFARPRQPPPARMLAPPAARRYLQEENQAQ